MEKEFLGIGRTWWMAVIIIIGSTVMFGMDKIDVQNWKNIIEWIFTIAGGKSMVVGTASLISKKGNGQ